MNFVRMTMKNDLPRQLPLFILMILLSTSGLAEETHQHHKKQDHANHNHSAVNETSIPTAPGNAAFAAVEEIVALLLDDPATDWQKVNIDALHSHLKDMHLFFLETNTAEPLVSGLSITFTITGSEQSIGAIHRMLPTHSAYIEKIKPWKTHIALTDNGATLRIDLNDIEALNQLRALGLYGFMSLDSHHQAHHLMIATGAHH